MAESTEAACLLQSGAAYRRRLGLRRPDGTLVFAGFKPGAFSLYFGDDPYHHFDLEGRPLRSLVEGVHYLKGLDASTEAIDRKRQGASMVLDRRPLPFAEARDLDDAIRSAALDLIEGLGSGLIEPVAPPSEKAAPIGLDELRTMLERVAAWDANAWFRQRERYLGTYGPLPLLPPSCPSPVILQATLGHATGRAFGGAEPAEPYLRSPAEFEEHARAVADLYGRRIALARGVVVLGGDLLRRPASEVAPYLEIASEVFGVVGAGGGVRPRLSDRPESEPSLDGIYLLLDDPTPPHPDAAGFRLLHEWNLRRLDLAIESTDPEVLAVYGRHWSADDLSRIVVDVKSAGIGIGLALLVGAGGREHSGHHAEAAARSLAALPLGPGDHVYLLDSREIGGEFAAERLRGHGLTPLTPTEIADETATLRARLNEHARSAGYKVAPFSTVKQ